jgi:hypothetical protein
MPKLFHIDPDTKMQSLECAQHGARSVYGECSDEGPGTGGMTKFHLAPFRVHHALSNRVVFHTWKGIHIFKEAVRVVEGKKLEDPQIVVIVSPGWGDDLNEPRFRKPGDDFERNQVLDR